MKPLRAALLALPLLAACATGPTVEQRLGTLIGRPEGDVVAALGVPTRVHEVDGRRFLQFEQSRTVPIPSSPFGNGYGWRRGYMPGPSYAVVQCAITFALRDGRAESFSLRGDGCG
ncbi:hypothetical protein [Humitalea rosea]|nr:hypothetical protein [Humitalea rosea]